MPDFPTAYNHFLIQSFYLTKQNTDKKTFVFSVVKPLRIKDFLILGMTFPLCSIELQGAEESEKRKFNSSNWLNTKIKSHLV
jgi:hypothetical protein